MPLAPPTPKVARSFSESGRVPEDALRVPREREVHFEVDGPHQDAPPSQDGGATACSSH